MSGSRLRRLEYTVVLTVVAFVVLLAAGTLWAGADEVLAKAKAVPLWVIAALLGLSTVNYALRCWRWHAFAAHLGMAIPFWRNALYFIAGFALTTTPGKAGEALRLWVVERCHGYGYDRAAPLFVGDRLSDMLAILLICVAAIGAFSAYANVTLAFALGMGLLLIPFARPKVLMWLVNRLYGLFGQRFPRLFGRVRHALRGTSRLLEPRIFGFGLVLALIGWALEAWSFQLLLNALGAEVTLQQAAFIFTFALIAGTVALLPGGLGGTEAVMLALLSAIGVGFEQAIVATAIIRLTTLWYSTLLGFIALPPVLRMARRGAG